MYDPWSFLAVLSGWLLVVLVALFGILLTVALIIAIVRSFKKKPPKQIISSNTNK